MASTPTQFATDLAAILGLDPTDTADLVSLFASDTATVLALGLQVNELANTMAARLLTGPESDMAPVSGVVNLAEAETGVIRITGASGTITSFGPVPDFANGESAIRYLRFQNAQTVSALSGSPSFVAGEAIEVQGISGTTWLLRQRADPTGSSYVSKTGAETVAGVKTFSSRPEFSAGFVAPGTTVAGIGTSSPTSFMSGVFGLAIAGASAGLALRHTGSSSTWMFYNDAGVLKFWNGSADILALSTGAYLRPGVDNNLALGGAGQRWTVVYAASGTINTSDLREKTLVDDGIVDNETGMLTPLGLAIVARVGVLAFKFNEAIETKGLDGARIHYGYGAQVWEAAFIAEGKDPTKSALFCKDLLTRPVGGTRPVRRQVVETVPGVRRWTEIIDGAAHQRSEPTEEQRKVFDVLPLFDETGAPVMVPGPDADEAGSPILVQAQHSEPRMETVDEPCTIDEPWMEDDGVTQKYRLGLRVDQCHTLEIAALKTRLAAAGIA